MMFMMPMPPTRRLTPATAPSRPVSIAVVPVCVSTICFMSRTEKSSSLPARDVAPLAQQPLDVGLHLGRLDAVLGRHGIVRDIRVAGDAPLESRAAA